MIEVVTWISHPSEMDLSDTLWFAEQAVVPGTKVTFVDDDDIAAAEAAIIAQEPAAEPSHLPQQPGLEDQDEFGYTDEIHEAVVLYRGEGSLEEVAIAYVRSVRE